MKIILILLALITLTSCSVEQRIKDYSYTNEWYYIDMMKFEVYKTKSGRKYIIVLNEKHTRYVRQYIK
jgi:hypothetical protein